MDNIRQENANVNSIDVSNESNRFYVELDDKVDPSVLARIEATGGKKKSEDGLTAQLIFTQELEKDDNFVVKEIDDRNWLIYRWDNYTNHYKEFSGDRALCYVGNWLEKYMPHRCNTGIQKDCLSWARTNLRRVAPAKPKFDLIPLRNHWLKINPNDFTTSIIAPTKEIFVDYRIDTDIKVEPGQETYTPSKELPVGSLFKQYIESSIPNPAIRDVLQEYCGYSLVSTTKFQKFLVLEGNGRNGKSVLINLLQALHGKGAKSINPDEMTKEDLYVLVDASLAVVNEIEDGAKLRESVIKNISSGDKIAIRELYKTQISFEPKAKIVIACNTLPPIRDQTDGVMRRLLIVKFEQEFDDTKAVANLSERIIDEELNTFLDWCLVGLFRLLQRGKFDESAISEAKEEKVMENNSIRRFLFEVDATAVESDQPTDWYPKNNLYEDYKMWADNRQHLVRNDVWFWRGVKNIFKASFKETKTRTGRRVNIKHERLNRNHGI